jgi:hypothetical protein
VARQPGITERADEEYPDWIAARADWVAAHGGWPHPSWCAFPHDGSKHGAQGSAAIDEIWQRRQARISAGFPDAH